MAVEALWHYAIAPERLTLELLENESVGLSSALGPARRLEETGVRLALDDLGTGHNSFLRLASLPIDVLKIDQALTMRLRSAPLETLGMLKALVRMAQDLGRMAVVEGVEDAGMVEAARLLGAAAAQGYALGRPMLPDALKAWRAADILRNGVHTFLGALTEHWLQRHQEGMQSEAGWRLQDWLVAKVRSEAGRS